ncbi:NUDIX hydrolase [Acetivibrio clariflavus]|uniref:ADP-ribose pyrophosphatase n=1 Tax=Acetivibrio clariflavus (strain DSM 19732 / NBRC 101661 / EBR45) TaxID=720554 RepID=G8LX14_ACECE|nr:NUDIX domain-containing protein [Acetivibrio clariflavus]AEV67666.1 ADP-ribose pyrophosphatase [Acetivibrio clariflavus DSM 19732]
MADNKLRNKQGLTEEEFLKNYDAGKYERPSVTVDMLIFTVTNEERKSYRKLPEKALKLLMIKRGDHPYIGQWALPGGFVNINESLEEAARRELKEETNIDNIYMEQLYTWGDVGRDPRTRVISTSYMSLVDSETLNIKANDDADDAKWFTVSCKLYQEQKTVTQGGYILQRLFELKLSNEEDNLSAIVKVVKTVENRITTVEREIVESHGIAFDHAKIIQYGIERLRNKIEYTDIAFNLMPELFTLTELQQVYEIILDTELLKANFRRKISGMVIETNEYTKDSGHRPSKLFRFNPNWQNLIEA